MPTESPSTSVPSVPLGGGTRSGDWSVAGAAAFVTAVMGSAMLAAFVLQTGYGLWLTRVGPSIAADWPAPTEPAFLVSVQLGAQGVELLLIWGLTGVWHQDRSAALGLAVPRFTLGQWIGSVALLFVVKALVTMVALGIGPTDFNREFGPFVALARSPQAWLLFLTAVVLAGLIEELLFRGVLSRTLEATRLGFWGGAAIASAAFAMLHLQYGFGGQLVIFAIGMTLAWIRARSGSLWPSIVCHSINNAVALFAMRAIS
ncbi:MAG: lysostaphin resistance A-like protein [Hyphomicrobiaceae bacterium]